MAKTAAMLPQLVGPEESVVALAFAVLERAGKTDCVRIVAAHVAAEVGRAPEGLATVGASMTDRGRNQCAVRGRGCGWCWSHSAVGRGFAVVSGD